RRAGAESSPRLFILVGPPAVGKLSVARALERLSGAIVVDNHLVNNAVFVPMGMHREAGVELAQTDALRERVWEVVLDATEAAPAQLSHVFTVWLLDNEEGAAHVERLRSLAERRGARFVPVWMAASPEVLQSRVDAPGRAERHKLTDWQILSGLLELPMLPPPADALCLELSTAAPADAAGQILDSLSSHSLGSMAERPERGDTSS
ncbi:MAG: AAA family ATPase, partial [Brachybacterium sp.]